ncbi:MAG: helix-turn-helix domain-containing protein [Treponema sp.]|jgi:transcriptional regulator with XRE-family HTH domain|nr:helix-turn-helix domain-containing protein [Treponema sp.]
MPVTLNRIVYEEPQKPMNGGPERLRKLLSLNIKSRRRLLGLSQKKLAETADLSAQTVNDIEGCRMWVSDKTMVKLAEALQMEVYQLLLPGMKEKMLGEQPPGSLHPPAETLRILQYRIKKHIDRQFYEALRTGL